MTLRELALMSFNVITIREDETRWNDETLVKNRISDSQAT